MTAMIDTDEYVYGWGRTKHIPDNNREANSFASRYGLCGAGGGNSPEPSRPTCKRCAAMVGQETAEQQIQRLATFIMENIPGEPSAPEGAVTTAIRLLTRSWN